MDKTRPEIEAWFVTQVAQHLGLDPRRIDVNRSLTRYGLDSIVAVELTADLEEWLKQPIPETLILDQPTIKALALYLSEAKETVEDDTLFV